MATSFRKQVFRIVEGKERKKRKRNIFFDSIIILTILIDMVGMILETDSHIATNFKSSLKIIELFAIVVFTIEYLLRIWVCVEQRFIDYHHPIKGRIRYIFSFLAIVDLISILPFYLALFFGININFLRIVRLLKMLRYSSALNILIDAIKSEKKVLGSAGVMMLILLLLLSTIMYHIEKNIQPDNFGTLANSLWWGVVTLTTVGYGDVTPLSPLGKFFGALTTMLGFGMFALPAGILASAFAQEAKKKDFVVTWNLVAQVPVLSKLDASNIADIASLLKPLHFSKGERIVKKGEAADCMYFILEGEVFVKTNKNKKKNIFLNEGSFFGEIALFGDKKRNADVVAKTNCQLLLLDYSDFSKIIDSNPDIKEKIENVANYRIEQDR